MIKELFLMKNGKPSLAPIMSMLSMFASIGLAFYCFNTDKLDWIRAAVIGAFIIGAFAPHAISKIAKTAKISSNAG